MSSECPFCKLQKEELPPHVIYEDDEFFIMLDKDSLAFGHCLVITKEHTEKVYELDDKKYASLFNLAKKFSRILLDVTKKKAIGYVVFGSGLPHTHLHLVPHDMQDVLINPIKHLRNLSEEDLQKEAEQIKSLIH